MANTTACDSNAVRGSGERKAEVRQLEPFHQIELGGALGAEISIGDTQHVEVTGDDNIVELVTTEVEGGRLVVATSKSIRPKLDLTLHITVPSLDHLSVSGAGRVRLRGTTGERLQLSLSGAATITATGAVDTLAADISGAGQVDAKNLEAQDAKVTLSGAGNLKVHASKSLDVQISGAGNVLYYGNPAEVSKEISGAGTVQKRSHNGSDQP